MDRAYQIILYGATGFTGKLCAEYFQSNYPDLNWAIAGRNKEKLESLKTEANTHFQRFTVYTPPALSQIKQVYISLSGVDIIKNYDIIKSRKRDK